MKSLLLETEVYAWARLLVNQNLHTYRLFLQQLQFHTWETHSHLSCLQTWKYFHLCVHQFQQHHCTRGLLTKTHWPLNHHGLTQIAQKTGMQTQGWTTWTNWGHFWCTPSPPFWGTPPPLPSVLRHHKAALQAQEVPNTQNHCVTSWAMNFISLQMQSRT